MASASSLCFSPSPLIPFHGKSLNPASKSMSSILHLKRSSLMKKVLASRRDGHDRDYFEGKSVDEDMIVLRRRIHEMKVIETKEEASPGWMEWEKDYYLGRYSSDVCDAVAMLQTFFMSTRPSVALGVVALFFVVATASGVLFLQQFLEFAKWVLAAICGSSLPA